MASTFEAIPTNSPSKSQSKKSLSVLSSIENRGDNLERRTTAITKSDSNKLHNIRPNTNENISKRYSASPDVKDNFYAIRHIQRLTEPSTSENSENNEPTKLPTLNKKSSNRGRKRTSPENSSQKSTIFTPLISTSQSDSTVKRKKIRQQSKPKKDQPSLNQTCQQIWPESSTLGDLTHGNIKSLSGLLKIRLNQAKFKMMAKLEKDDDLFSLLTDEYVLPRPRSPFTLQLSNQHNRSSMPIVGNSKNLFARQLNNKAQRRHSISMTSIMESIFDSPTSPSDDKNTSPPRNSKNPKGKKKVPKATPVKTKRVTTPKRRSAAADVVPVVLSDGSSVYVCEPCNKKYKNRNGLAYHMERCKNSAKPAQGTTSDEKESSQSENNNNINCICSQQTNDENITMVQCEKCHHWSHSDCVGVPDDMLEETFYCSKCKDKPDLFESNKVGQDLLQCLLDAQASEDRVAVNHQTPQPQPQYQLSQEQQDQLSQLQVLLNQPSIQKQDDNSNLNEDDDPFSVNTSNGDDEPSELGSQSQIEPFDTVNDSSQLYVWEDFNVNSAFDNPSTTDQWNEDEPFSGYDTDLQSSTWNMSELNIFNQPPSLLFTDNTLDSALDEDALPLIGDLSTPLAATPACEATPSGDVCTPAGEGCTPGRGDNITVATTPHNSEGLWFQFANFDNDYENPSSL